MPRCFLLSFYSMVVTINLETFSYDDTNSKLRGASVINIKVFRHNKRCFCLWRSFRDRTWVRICSRLDWSDFLLPTSAPSPIPRSNQGKSQRWWAAGGSFYLFVDNWALFISGPQSSSLFFLRKKTEFFSYQDLYLNFLRQLSSLHIRTYETRFLESQAW